MEAWLIGYLVSLFFGVIIIYSIIGANLSSKKDLQKILSEILYKDKFKQIKNETIKVKYATFQIDYKNDDEQKKLLIYEAVSASCTKPVINIIYDKERDEFTTYFINERYIKENDTALALLKTVFFKENEKEKTVTKEISFTFFDEALKEKQEKIDENKKWLFSNKELLTIEEKHLMKTQENDFLQLVHLYEKLRGDAKESALEKIKKAQHHIYQTSTELVEEKEKLILALLDTKVEVIQQRRKIN